MTSNGTSTTAETCSTSISYTTFAGTAVTTKLHSPGFPFINDTAVTIANTITLVSPIVQKCLYCKTDLRGRGGDMCRPCKELVDRKILKYDVLTGEYYKGKTRKMPKPHESHEYTFTVSGTTSADDLVYFTTSDTSATST